MLQRLFFSSGSTSKRKMTPIDGGLHVPTSGMPPSDGQFLVLAQPGSALVWGAVPRFIEITLSEIVTCNGEPSPALEEWRER